MCRRWLRVSGAPACLAAMLAVAAEPGLPPPAEQDLATQLLQWQEAMEGLRHAVWLFYPATAALGIDVRGRTLAQDLDDSVMPPDVLNHLRTQHAAIATQLAAGQESKALATLAQGKELLQQQSQHFALLEQYWARKLDLDEQQKLWRYWIDQVPSEIAIPSQFRIAALQKALAQDFTSGLTSDALTRELNGLLEAYDRERTEFARMVSERRVAAGGFMAVREPDTPCEGGGWTDGPQPSPSATGSSRGISITSAPAVSEFYPQHARRVMFSGRVLLRVTVNAAGCLQRIEVLQSSGAPELDDAAVNYCEYTKFRPAERDGRPITSSSVLPIKFNLGADQPGGNQSATLDQHLRRGNALMEQNNVDGAIAEYDQAIAIDARSAYALADRGLAHVWKREESLARQDLDAASAIDARNPVVFRARGLMLLRAFDYRSAIETLGTALQLDPNNTYALGWRASAYLNTRDFEHALADGAEIIRLDPRAFSAYALRAEVWRAQGKRDQSIAEANLLLAANPENARAYAAAAAIYLRSGDETSTMRAMDQAVRVAPDESAYLTRANDRRRSDVAGRRADIQAALKLHPQSAAALEMMVRLQEENGEYVGALATLDAAPSPQGPNVALLAMRAIAHIKLREPPAAQQELEAARAAASTPSSLNSLCWALATTDVALDSASSACDAALKAMPTEPAFLDSRGVVLLRLGRYAEAIEAYDAALRGRPLAADSLYGRGLAERRLNKRSASEADMRTAMILDARVADTFATYGLSR